MSQNGKVLDFRNPDRAYNSRIKAVEEITGFVDSLIGDKAAA